MPRQTRQKTKYPGVYYIESAKAKNGKPERVFYISFWKDGKKIEEKAGRQFKDGMTAARANSLRGKKIDGSLPTNQERRNHEKAKKKAAADKWIFERLFDKYKETTKPKDLSNDQCRFNNYIKPAFGHKEPQELVPLDVDRLRMKLLKSKAPATVRNVLELLKRIANFGKKKQLCKGLNFIVEMPVINNEKTEDLTPEQLTKLFKAIDEDDHPQAGTLMKLALYSGMRRGELFKLKWSDIDFRREFIKLRDPKGGPDQRIPLNDVAKAILENYPKTKNSEYVFPGKGGRQRTDISKATREIRKAAKLPDDFRPLHGLRHSFASGLASSGKVDLYQIQKLLTHKSPIMTQRYVHLRDETLKKASNLAADIFQPEKDDKVIELKK